jgi:dTDP-4-amino-4,6-dideoxygalactose transaminase
LKYLPRWNQQRVECAQRYNELLAAMSGNITLPFQPKWSKHVYHLYVVRTARRDELQTHLNEAGIGTGIHYPIPVHLQRAYDSMGWKRGDFPVTEQASEQILSLPMFGGLRADQQQRVADMVAEFASVRSAV